MSHDAHPGQRRAEVLRDVAGAIGAEVTPVQRVAGGADVVLEVARRRRRWSSS